MKKMNRDDKFKEYTSAKFDPVDSDLLSELECEDFTDEPAFLDKVIPRDGPIIKMLRDMFRKKQKPPDTSDHFE